MVSTEYIVYHFLLENVSMYASQKSTLVRLYRTRIMPFYIKSKSIQTIYCNKIVFSYNRYIISRRCVSNVIAEGCNYEISTTPFLDGVRSSPLYAVRNT